MKGRLLAAAAAIGLTVLAFSLPAHAVLIATNDFITSPGNGTFRYTYEGFSAADTDTMRIAVNGTTIFTNNTTPVSTVFDQPVIAGQQVRLQLDNSSTGNTWFSGTTGNSDGRVHLNWATAFTDFGIGTPPVPVTTNCFGPSGACYLGWEDLPFPAADADFNDFTFALQFIPAAVVPEPASLSILGAALIGMGWLVRRRRQMV